MVNGGELSACLGHVQLKVSDLERSLRFYRDGLAFREEGRVGTSAAFLSSGDRVQLALNTWQSANGTAPPPGSTGLYSFGIRYPDRRKLARVVRRLVGADVEIVNASDHGLCESVYIEDPDSNSVELYWERPRAGWPVTADGRLAVIDIPLDIDDLLLSLAEEAAAE